jgi:hypothetical protein
MVAYLLENMRIDENALRDLDAVKIDLIGRRFQARKIRLLSEVVLQLK